MRLTALCICGTLLAFSSLSWTTVDSDEENLLEYDGFGPCAVTIRPEGPCRQGQDENMCPYLFSVPPLTVHLPKQLRELENIVEEVQKLKDSVDELRMMCADCTVRQTDSACGRQREREHENLNVGVDGYEDERKWLMERHSESLKDLNKDCQTKGDKAEHILKGDAVLEKMLVFEEEGKNKWEAERPSDIAVIKDERKVQPVVKKDGKAEAGRAKGKEKSKPSAVPTAGESDRIMDVVIKNLKGMDTDSRKRKNGRGNSKGDRGDRLETEKERKIKEKTEDSGHPVWRDEAKEAEKKAKTEEDRGSDGMKMSKSHDKHTNKEREEHRQERKKEMEKGAKAAERNNKKPKQAESFRDTEKTIKEGEKEDEKQTEKEIKTEGGEMVQSVQRDSDGELASRKITERTDFASISSTVSTMTLAPSHNPVESVEAVTLASSLGSPPPSRSDSLLITSISQGMTTNPDGIQIQRTGLGATEISEQPGAEESFMTTNSPKTTADTTSTLTSPGPKTTSAFTRFTPTTRTRPVTSIQLRGSSTVAPSTVTTSYQSLYTPSLQTGLADHSTANMGKNMTPNTKTDIKPRASERPVFGAKRQPAFRPEMDPNLKNPKSNAKPDQAPLPHKKTKQGPKQKPSYHRPTTNRKSVPDKDPKQFQIPKPDILTTPQNPKNTLKPKHDPARTTGQNLLADQTLDLEKSFPPTQRPSTNQTPLVVDAAYSIEDPSADHKPDSVEIPNTTQKSIPEKKPVYSLETDSPGEERETHLRSEDKPKSGETSKLNQYLLNVPESESKIHETTSHKPKAIQKATTEVLENPGEYPLSKTEIEQDSSFRVEVTPDHGPTKLPDQTTKSSRNIPDIPESDSTSVRSENNPDLTTDQKGKPNFEPKLDQMNQEFTTPLPKQLPNPTSMSVPREISKAGVDKTSRPFLTNRPPTQPRAKPGATSVQKSKPSLEAEPSSKTKTDSVPPHIPRIASESLQNVQTDLLPTSGPVKLITDVTHSPGGAEFNAREMISLESKTFNSQGSGLFPLHHTRFEGFTVSPNSRITSDLKPQTTTKTPSIQMTTKPNRVMLGILPSDVPSTVTKPKHVFNTDSSLQVNFSDKLKETAYRETPDPDKMLIPAPSSTPQISLTMSPHLSSTKPAVSGPKLLVPKVSTASTRELRVKINQVAAFFNNSLSPNGRHPNSDRRPKVHLEGKQGGSRPDSKLPPLSTAQGKRIYFKYFHGVSSSSVLRCMP